MALLEQEPHFIDEPEQGSFLYPRGTVIDAFEVDASKQFQCESASFWLEHVDLCGEDGMQPGVLLQYGESSAGEIVELDDPNCESRPRTLVFQAISPLEFRWKLTEVDNAGRTETFLSVARKQSDAHAVRYDFQGRQQANTTLDEASTNSVRKHIRNVIESELFTQKAQELRTRREAAGEAIGLFALTGVEQYAPKKFKQLLEKKNEVLQKLYFAPLSAT